MSRLTTFLLVSIAIHAIALLGLQNLISSASNARHRVFEVSALSEPPPPEPDIEPEPEPPVEIDEPPEPTPRRRSERRPIASRPTPTPEQEPAAPEPAESEEGAPSPEPVVSVPLPIASPNTSEPELQGSPSSGNQEPSNGPSEGSSEDRSPGGGARGGAGPDRPDPCDAARAALSRSYDIAKTYPQWAREMNISGVIRLTLRIGNDGRPRGIRVSSSSGHAGLDRHARDIARRLVGLPAGCRRQITFPVTFRQERRRRR